MAEKIMENEKENTKTTNPKMVIVGNGFDMSAGIQSSYNDFVEHIRIAEKLENNEDIYNFNKLFLQKFDGKKLNWNDLESIFENHIKEINEITYSNDDEIRSRYSINEINNYLKELEESFSDYLSDIYKKWHNKFRVTRQKESDKKESGKKDNAKKSGIIVNEVYKNIFKEADVINFNYTRTLSDLELVQPGMNQSSSYFQVHGSLIEKNIIFGGGFTGNEKFNLFNVPGSMDNDKLIRIKKDTDLFEKRTQLLAKINSYQENSVDTYIIGHSIYGSDLPFLSKIFEKSKRIYLFYYGNDYLIKLQMISKVLSSEILEKIVLVPFYDILIDTQEQNLEFGVNNPNSIQLDNTDIELLKRIFNTALPITVPFDKFILTNKLFIFNQFQYIKISSRIECEAFKKILSFLNIRETNIDGLNLILDKVEEINNDKPVLDDLFEMEEFVTCVKKSKRIEITKSSLSIDKLTTLTLNAENCQKLKIRGCSFYSDDEVVVDDIDISHLQNIEYLEISENDIATTQINIYAKNDAISKTLKKIIVRGNSNINTKDSLMFFSKNSRYVELDYPITGGFSLKVDFPNVSTFILDAQEVDSEPSLSGITLSASIRVLKLIDVSFTELGKEKEVYKFSSLFNFKSDDKNEYKKTKYLSNLKEIELSAIDESRKFLFDVIPNTQQITYNGEQTELIKLWVREQSIQRLQQEISQTKSEATLPSGHALFDGLGPGVGLAMTTPHKKVVEENANVKSFETSFPREAEVRNAAIETVDKVSKMILDYLAENKLLHSDDSRDINRREASRIEKEISEFAKKWAVDRQALTFYVLNFDTGNKDDKQLGETALRESANYEELLDKTNKNKLQYRKGLNIAIKEFAARLHEEYHL
ncbi:AbiH family protein [Streptococcus intermedius]|uniref:AbiH family protein n=1 Tax=Streptococcus intermedius TaxID=1338 RepID=UPI00066141C5|nr:AbiH family protein [Streptococcus intermedius]